MEFNELRVLVDAFLAGRSGRDYPPGYRPFDARLASDEDIVAVESRLNMRLPEKYAEFMKTYGGGMFGFVDLLPVRSADSDDLLTVNTGEFAIRDFLAVAPVGSGDWWGFTSRAGICDEVVSFWDHETGDLHGDSDDFLVFVASRGLQGQRGPTAD